VALLLQPLDWHHSDVAGSQGGRRPAASPAFIGYAGGTLPYGPPPQVRPPFTPPLTPLPIHRGQQQAPTLSAPVVWSPWMGSWDQQLLANSFNTMSMVPRAVPDWVATFGASNHTTPDGGNLTYIRPPHIHDPSSIIVGNRSSLPVTSVGCTALLGLFYHNNVLVTLDIIQNLLSVHRFTTDSWCSMELGPFGLSMKDLSTRNVITRCYRSGPLYTMRLSSCSTPSSSIAAPTDVVASTSTWHRRLGHPSVDTMSKLSNASSVVCSRRHIIYATLAN
jgi:hypothetical protein